MKKFILTILFLLSSFAFADTVHIFVPYKVIDGIIKYKEIVYNNIGNSNLTANRYGTYAYSDKLWIRYNGKNYIYSGVQWWIEPDEQTNKSS